MGEMRQVSNALFFSGMWLHNFFRQTGTISNLGITYANIVALVCKKVIHVPAVVANGCPILRSSS